MLAFQMRNIESACKNDFEFVDLHGLAKEIVRPECDRLDSVSLLVLAGNDDDLRRWIALQQINQRGEALTGISWRRRQAQIQRHDSRFVLFKIVKCAMPV